MLDPRRNPKLASALRLLAPGTEGGVTIHQPTGDKMTIYEASMRYQKDRVPLFVFGGEEYELLFTLAEEEYAKLELLTPDVTIIGRIESQVARGDMHLAAKMPTFGKLASICALTAVIFAVLDRIALSLNETLRKPLTVWHTARSLPAGRPSIGNIVFRFGLSQVT